MIFLDCCYEILADFQVVLRICIDLVLASSAIIITIIMSVVDNCCEGCFIMVC